MKQQARYALAQTGYYWRDEAPIFSKDAIDSITIPIDTIVTHTAPSFCEKQDHAFLHEWAEMDPTLLDDVAAERQTIDKIFEYIKQSSTLFRIGYMATFTRAGRHLSTASVSRCWTLWNSTKSDSK